MNASLKSTHVLDSRTLSTFVIQVIQEKTEKEEMGWGERYTRRREKTEKEKEKNNVIQGDERKQKKAEKQKNNVIQGDGEKRKDKKTKKKLCRVFF